MKALESYLIPEFFDSGPLAGQVHSVFRHSLNLVFGETMITVHESLDAGIPDSVVLTPDDYNYLRGLRAGDRVAWERCVISLPGMTIKLESGKNGSNVFLASSDIAGADEILSRLNSLNFQHRLPDKAEDLLPGIVGAIIDNNRLKCEIILPQLIGFGFGLTPAADDALLGIMTVMAFYAAAGINLMPDFPDLVYSLSEDKTTDISRKYLRCAAQQRFSRPLLRCVRSIFGRHGAPDPDAFDLLLKTGHTSGCDMLRGIKLVATALSQLRMAEV